MALVRVRIPFQGWNGGPGLMTHYYASPASASQGEADMASDTVHNALLELKPLYPNFVNWIVDPTVEVVDPDTGNITDAFTKVQSTQAGTGGTNQLPPSVQLCLSWRADAFVNGRRVRGRTFIGPVVDSGKDLDGSPTLGVSTLVEAFANAIQDTGLLSTLEHVIYHRPVSGAGGSHHRVIQFSMPDKFATLRSRRD